MMDDVNKVICYYQNVRGLRTKTSIFRRNLLLSNYSVIALTETWLVDGFSDSELFDDRYLVWRRDRRYDLTGQSYGGGVLLAVCKDLDVSPRPDWSSTAEDLWVTLLIGKHKLHVCVIYLCNQNRGFSFSQQLLNFLDNLRDIMTENPFDSFLVLGDFNMSSINWCQKGISNINYLEPSNVSGLNECNFIDELNLVDLHQFNHVVNQQGRLLDLVLSNVDSSVYNIPDSLVPIDPYHNALCITVNIYCEKVLKPAPRIKYCYNQADFDSINNDLASLDWQSDLTDKSLDAAVDFFYRTVENVRDKYVPTKMLRSKVFPAWYSPALIKVLKEKYKFYSKFKRYGLIADKLSVDILNKRAKLLEANCYKLYITKVEKSINDNPKYFWSYFKSLSNSNSIPKIMSYKNKQSNLGNEICNLFADYFHSTFLSPSATTSNHSTISNMPLDGNICSIHLTAKSIKSVLSKLDISKSAGPDSIPPILLIRCADKLSIPLLILFSRSISEGYVPLLWKKAYISPIHKKGPKGHVTNYRPISKLCTIAKVFEKIVYEQLYSALRASLPPSQHGFLRGRSTVSNLVQLNEFITDSMDKGGQVDVVYTDYSKAFDRIDHRLLVIKLQNAGIRGDLLRWFASYIDNRSQAVVLGNHMSNWMSVPSGVPQGSLLGPLLFLIFVADIDCCFRNSTLLSFADDMKIFKEVKNQADALALQEDLCRLDTYCVNNKLDLNVSKCVIMSFSRKKLPIHFSYSLKGHSLVRVSEMRDLGVIHDSKLLFQSHISSIVGKASKALGFILRSTKDFKSIKTLKVLYSTYVRCHLEYASQVWNPKYSIYIDRIERIQRKFIRHLNFRTKNKKLDYSAACVKHHFLPLSVRRDISDIIFLKKVVSSGMDCPALLSLICLYAPKRTYCHKSPLFAMPVVSTNYRQNSYMYRVTKLYNKLCAVTDVDIFHTSIPALRRKLGNDFFSSGHIS